MGSFFIALVFGAGVAGWVYNKVQHRNGGQSKQSLSVAILVGAVAFIVFLTLFATFVPKN